MRLLHRSARRAAIIMLARSKHHRRSRSIRFCVRASLGALSTARSSLSLSRALSRPTGDGGGSGPQARSSHWRASTREHFFFAQSMLICSDRLAAASARGGHSTVAVTVGEVARGDVTARRASARSRFPRWRAEQCGGFALSFSILHASFSPLSPLGSSHSPTLLALLSSSPTGSCVP